MDSFESEIRAFSSRRRGKFGFGCWCFNPETSSSHYPTNHAVFAGLLLSLRVCLHQLQYHPFLSCSPLPLTIGLMQCEPHMLGTFSSEEHLSSHISEEPVVFQKTQTHPRISHKRSSTEKKRITFRWIKFDQYPGMFLPCFFYKAKCPGLVSVLRSTQCANTTV